ncbi:MAG TPA: TIGR02996 domain-containing protein, partial [Gemmataceae bacterium]
MREDDAFIGMIATSPDDTTPELVYADWLEERGHPGAALLRLRAVLVTAKYSEASYRNIASLAERYRSLVGSADPEWLGRMAAVRPWISAELAVTLVRVFLRTVHG